jgi:hypothetical protein
MKRALGRLERFIRALHVGTGAQGPPPKEFPSVVFSRKGLGGLILWEEDGREYRQCLAGIWSVVGKREDLTISQKVTECLVQVAILRALDLEGRNAGTSFDERLSHALSELKEKLDSSPVRWEIHLQALGVKN